jgi:putative hydrolase of HD superfamily
LWPRRYEVQESECYHRRCTYDPIVAGGKNTNTLVDLVLEVISLKRMPRTGWGTRGVPHVESVAEHTFGVGFLVLALADLLRAQVDSEPLDLEKALSMALLHDLAEVRLTDLPTSAVQLLPDVVKSQAEAQAINDLLALLPSGMRLEELWREFEDASSPEGRLLRDADKLEMMFQCLFYERAGSRGLDEFWQRTDHRQWHYSVCADIYASLKAQRPPGAASRGQEATGGA